MRGFHYTNQAYYARFRADGSLATEDGSLPCTHEVLIGDYGEDSGTSGEFAVRWYRFPDGRLVASLEAFEDGWAVMVSYTDLLAEMAKASEKMPQPEPFVAMLLRLGFKDLTRKTPR